jgi:hypothetical protein
MSAGNCRHFGEHADQQQTNKETEMNTMPQKSTIRSSDCQDEPKEVHIVSPSGTRRIAFGANSGHDTYYEGVADGRHRVVQGVRIRLARAVCLAVSTSHWQSTNWYRNRFREKHSRFYTSIELRHALKILARHGVIQRQRTGGSYEWRATKETAARWAKFEPKIGGDAGHGAQSPRSRSSVTESNRGNSNA